MARYLVNHGDNFTLSCTARHLLRR